MHAVGKTEKKHTCFAVSAVRLVWCQRLAKGVYLQDEPIYFDCYQIEIYTKIDISSPRPLQIQVPGFPLAGRCLSTSRIDFIKHVTSAAVYST